MATSLIIINSFLTASITRNLSDSTIIQENYMFQDGVKFSFQDDTNFDFN